MSPSFKARKGMPKNRGTQIRTAVAIVKRLLQGERLNVKLLARELGLNERNMRRWVYAVEDAGLPLTEEQDEEGRVWYKLFKA